MLCWLIAVALSFVVGVLLLHLLPKASSETWGVGITVNVGLAIAVGVSLGWTRQWFQVLAAAVLGSIVTILGVDALLCAPTPTENAHLGLVGLALFDSVTLLVALVGMSILIGVGVSVGVVGQTTVVRSGCLARVGTCSSPMRN